jgi:hypothetical protein
LTHSTDITLKITAASTLTVSPTSLAFGRVHHYALKFEEVRITNNGTTPASIGRPRVKGDEAARGSFFPIDLCRRTLEPAQSCRVVVALFAERVGRLSATLAIPTKAARPLMVELTAEVIPLRQ